MKTQISLLAACLCGMSLVNAQTTTQNSSYNTQSQPATTNTAPVNSMNDSNVSTSANTVRADNSLNSTNSKATATDYGTINDRPARVKDTKDYKNFVFGIYAGLNSTKFKGESVNTGGDLSGRIGYQAGFFVRGGGRLFGQLGAEYFASSSNYFTKGDGQNLKDIQSKIDIQYVQIPLYIGYKLIESDRGISAIRLQAGLEYANRISSSSGNFNLTSAEIKSGTFNALGQVGFDFGAFMLNLTYHHGLSNSIKNPTNNSVVSTGFAGSQRRVVSASIGFKF